MGLQAQLPGFVPQGMILEILAVIGLLHRHLSHLGASAGAIGIVIKRGDAVQHLGIEEIGGIIYIPGPFVGGAPLHKVPGRQPLQQTVRIFILLIKMQKSIDAFSKNLFLILMSPLQNVLRSLQNVPHGPLGNEFTARRFSFLIGGVAHGKYPFHILALVGKQSEIFQESIFHLGFAGEGKLGFGGKVRIAQPTGPLSGRAIGVKIHSIVGKGADTCPADGAQHGIAEFRRGDFFHWEHERAHSKAVQLHVTLSYGYNGKPAGVRLKAFYRPPVFIGEKEFQHIVAVHILELKIFSFVILGKTDYYIAFFLRFDLDLEEACLDAAEIEDHIFVFSQDVRQGYIPVQFHLPLLLQPGIGMMGDRIVFKIMKMLRDAPTGVTLLDAGQLRIKCDTAFACCPVQLHSIIRRIGSGSVQDLNVLLQDLHLCTAAEIGHGYKISVVPNFRKVALFGIALHLLQLATGTKHGGIFVRPGHRLICAAQLRH